MTAMVMVTQKYELVASGFFFGAGVFKIIPLSYFNFKLFTKKKNKQTK